MATPPGKATPPNPSTSVCMGMEAKLENAEPEVTIHPGPDIRIKTGQPREPRNIEDHGQMFPGIKPPLTEQGQNDLLTLGKASKGNLTLTLFCVSFRALSA